jgi:hypothetical protein
VTGMANIFGLMEEGMKDNIRMIKSKIKFQNNTKKLKLKKKINNWLFLFNSQF